MNGDLISAAISALEDRDEERLAKVIGARPRLLILQHSAGPDNSGSARGETPMDDASAASLKTALKNYILRSRGSYLETAISCLGAFRDPTLKSFLRDQLRKCVTDPDRFSGALAQCLIALDALGEPVIRNVDFDVADIEANLSIASDYLCETSA